MIKIARMTDYAVVLLSELARRTARDPLPKGQAGLYSAAQLADVMKLPEPSVSKILKALGSAGLLEAKRGKAGGYSLAKPPEAITLGDIITAMEGPIALTACVEHSPVSCESRGFCGLGGHWDKANKAVRQALDDVSLAEMAFARPAFTAERQDTSTLEKR